MIISHTKSMGSGDRPTNGWFDEENGIPLDDRYHPLTWMIDEEGDEKEPGEGESSDEEWEERSKERVTAMNTLHLAAQRGCTDITQLLLDHDAPIDQPSSHCCSCHSPMSLTGTLENRPPRDQAATEPHRSRRIRGTALHLSLCHGWQENAKLLISRGAAIIFTSDISPAGPTGEAHGGCQRNLSSPFHFAAASGQLELLQLMVERIRQDCVLSKRPLVEVIDHQDGNGLTALYHAMANRHWETAVPYLVSLEANPNPMVEYRLEKARSAFTVKTPLLAELCRLGRFEDASKVLDLLQTLKATARKLESLRMEGQPLLGHRCSVFP